jgi:ATP-dependent DNA ligase
MTAFGLSPGRTARARALASSTAKLSPDDSVFLYAFDLIELNGDDLWRDPLEVRKGTLASIVAKAYPGHPVQ